MSSDNNFTLLVTSILNSSSKNSNTYHFFEKEKDFFLLTCYNQQAIDISKKFYKTTSVLKKEFALDSLTIMRKFFGKIALALLENNFSIQIWSRSDINSSVWKATKFASPGNFKDLDFITELHDVETASAALTISQDANMSINVAICIAITSSNLIYLIEFIDSTDLVRL